MFGRPSYQRCHPIAGGFGRNGPFGRRGAVRGARGRCRAGSRRARRGTGPGLAGDRQLPEHVLAARYDGSITCEGGFHGAGEKDQDRPGRLHRGRARRARLLADAAAHALCGAFRSAGRRSRSGGSLRERRRRRARLGDSRGLLPAAGAGGVPLHGRPYRDRGRARRVRVHLLWPLGRARGAAPARGPLSTGADVGRLLRGYRVSR